MTNNKWCVTIFAALICSYLAWPQEQPGNIADVRLELLTFGFRQDPHGNMTQRRNFAAMEWRADIPAYEGRELLFDYGNGRQIGTYADGSFRALSGAQKTAPKRWAYVRLTDDVWPEPEASAVPPPPGLLQMLVDTLLRNYSWTEVMDAADASAWKSHEEGEPEQ